MAKPGVFVLDVIRRRAQKTSDKHREHIEGRRKIGSDPELAKTVDRYRSNRVEAVDPRDARFKDFDNLIRDFMLVADRNAQVRRGEKSILRTDAPHRIWRKIEKALEGFSPEERAAAISKITYNLGDRLVTEGVMTKDDVTALAQKNSDALSKMESARKYLDAENYVDTRTDDIKRNSPAQDQVYMTIDGMEGEDPIVVKTDKDTLNSLNVRHEIKNKKRESERIAREGEEIREQAKRDANDWARRELEDSPYTPYSGIDTDPNRAIKSLIKEHAREGMRRRIDSLTDYAKRLGYNNKDIGKFAERAFVKEFKKTNSADEAYKNLEQRLNNKSRDNYRRWWEKQETLLKAEEDARRQKFWNDAAGRRAMFLKEWGNHGPSEAQLEAQARWKAKREAQQGNYRPSQAFNDYQAYLGSQQYGQDVYSGARDAWGPNFRSGLTPGSVGHNYGRMVDFSIADQKAQMQMAQAKIDAVNGMASWYTAHAQKTSENDGKPLPGQVPAVGNGPPTPSTTPTIDDPMKP